MDKGSYQKVKKWNFPSGVQDHFQIFLLYFSEWANSSGKYFYKKSLCRVVSPTLDKRADRCQKKLFFHYEGRIGSKDENTFRFSFWTQFEGGSQGQADLLGSDQGSEPKMYKTTNIVSQS